MLRLVLDTNVLVSAIINPAGAPAAILDGFLDGRWDAVASPEILAEYREVLGRRKFGFPANRVAWLMTRIEKSAIVLYPNIAVRACADPSDDKFLACGQAGMATHVVTGNMRHFPGRAWEGLRIVSPAEFIREAL